MSLRNGKNNVKLRKFPRKSKGGFKIKHIIQKEPKRLKNGEIYYIYKCKTHGSVGFFISSLSCIINDPNPEIELIGG